MRYTVLSAHKGIHGSFMNLLDLADYLIRRNHEVDLVCLDKFDLFHFIAQAVRTYRTQRVYDLTTLDFERAAWKHLSELIDKNKLTGGDLIRHNETVITDFKSLISWPKKIVCEKLVILDNAELSYHLNGTVIDFYPKDIGSLYEVLGRHDFNDHIFCMPPSNFNIFKEKYPDLKSRIFFKKINIEALTTARASDNGKLFYRGDSPPDDLWRKTWENLELPPISDRLHMEKSTVPERLDDLTQIFKYSGYVYYRRRDRAAYEQLGRMIFEFIILDKLVYFYDKPTAEQDGLNDYWLHYGQGNRETIIEMMLEDYEEPPWE